MKENLKDKLLALSIISYQGENFLGRVEEDGKKTKIVEAISVEVEDFDENIKNWIKKDNLDELKEITLRGSNFNLAETPFNDYQKHRIEILSSEATYKMNKALSNIENGSI